jgi:hypothetical protein
MAALKRRLHKCPFLSIFGGRPEQSSPQVPISAMFGSSPEKLSPQVSLYLSCKLAANLPGGCFLKFLIKDLIKVKSN